MDRSAWDEQEWAAYNQNRNAMRAGMTNKDVLQYYDGLGQKDLYDEKITSERYHGPKYAAQAVADFFPTERGQVRILDVAAGTGQVGELLNQHGFRHVDALEPVVSMLKKAQDNGWYKDYIIDVLDGDHQLDVSQNKYDCCVTSGGMCCGHIPCSGLQELIRVTKPGGIIVIAMAESYLKTVEEYTHLEGVMKDHVDKGQWKRLARQQFPNYVFDLDGVLFKFEVL